MKKLIALIFTITIINSVKAQSFFFSYDASGNRIRREVVELKAYDSYADTSSIAPSTTQLGEMNISVYPNPTAGALLVEITNLPDQSQGSLVIWNMQGQELFRINDPTSNMSVDLNTQPNGNYIMRITVGQEAKEWKIVKQ